MGDWLAWYTWIDTELRFKWNFVQSGSTFTGLTDPVSAGTSEARNGRLGDPRAIAFFRFYLGGAPNDPNDPMLNYAGSFDESLDHIEVIATPNRSFHPTRQ